MATTAVLSSSASAYQETLPVTRQENFSEWYREVLKAADLAETSSVRGCMVMKRGARIWEQIQSQMDALFKREKCCDNYYFPLFIPISFFAREADHVAGFAKECATVTHYRMKLDETGKMVPDPEAKLDEPLIVRPTSETIIGESMRDWIQSYRDLPLCANQWCNVVRWEHRTIPFLRTTEFLWQEGHCAFANEEEARANALKMAKVYHYFMTAVCALPVIMGEKSPKERFAGADQTLCLEAMMQDGKAVQAGTSHYLGTHFSKACDIKFTDKDQKEKLVHTTSWGVSTRLIGALIMVHSDDKGLRMPPRLAPEHVVILPSGLETPEREAHIASVARQFLGQKYEDREISVFVDDREGVNAAEKKWEWLRKGAPICLEIGPREAKDHTVTLSRRDQDFEQPTALKVDNLVPDVVQTLGQIQERYYAEAKEFLDSHIRTDITTLDQIQAFFANPDNIGFVRAKWCGDPETEEMLKADYKVTIRCLPQDQSGTEGTCVLTGRPATIDAIFGRSY